MRPLRQSNLLVGYIKNNVTFLDPRTVYVDKSVQIGEGTKIFPNVYLDANTKIGKNCIILSGTHIVNSCIKDNSTIGPNVKIENTQILQFCTIGNNTIITDSNMGTNCKIKENTIIENSILKGFSTIGPFAHVHDYCILEIEVEIAHAEIVRTTVGQGTKIKHHCYVGDAKIGKNCNIGAGTVFSNYSGENKAGIILEDDVFVGSGTMIVAPNLIRKGCFIAAGSIIDASMSKLIRPNDLIIARGQPHKHPTNPMSLRSTLNSGGAVFKRGHVTRDSGGWHLKKKKKKKRVPLWERRDTDSKRRFTSIKRTGGTFKGVRKEH